MIKWLIGKNNQNYEALCVVKKNNFFLCIYKMADITKEAFENNDIEVIIDGVNTLWINEKHIEKNSVIKIYQQLQTNTTKDSKNTDMN